MGAADNDVLDALERTIEVTAGRLAPLHVLVSGALRPFRVSVPEMNYGVVGFNYTGNVNYQHKVYEFRIPLFEIGNPGQVTPANR